MGRPKSDKTTKADKKNVSWISFYIPIQEKEKWVNYAKNLGLPLAKAIKESMNNAIYRKHEIEKNLQNDTLKQGINQLQEQIFEISSRINEINKESKEKPDYEKSKKQIIATLKENPKKVQEIGEITGIPVENLFLILTQLKEENKIDMNMETRKWRVI